MGTLSARNAVTNFTRSGSNTTYMSIINKPLVLRLNSGWQPIGFTTVKDAIVALNSGSEDKAAIGLDISYPVKDDGEVDFEAPSFNPVKSFEEWCLLPVREYDFVIRSVKLEIRVPTVIISPNFSRMPMKTMRPTSRNIMERDGGRCQYSGRELKKGEGDIDHIISKDRWKKLGLEGSPDTWLNMVWCDKKINREKGNKSNEEAGLKLIRKPKAPLPTPASLLVRKAHHFSWKPFLIHVDE